MENKWFPKDFGLQKEEDNGFPVMPKRKFKPGDKVRLAKDFADRMRDESGDFAQRMRTHIAKPLTVSKVDANGCVWIEGESIYAFNINWLEPWPVEDDAMFPEDRPINSKADFPVYKAPDPTVRESILQEADRIVNGDRQADYSDPVENFKHIAAIASAIRKKEFTAEDCCVVLMAVKLAREQFKHKRDSLVDLAGYTEILHQIKEAGI